MGIISWIVVGFVAGALARLATGRRVGGCLPMGLVGILGALLGGIAFNAAGERGLEEFGLWSIFVAFVGASILLLLFGGALNRRR